jgi:hypothetical protein
MAKKAAAKVDISAIPFDPIMALNKDMREVVKLMSKKQIAIIVRSYYDWQERRIQVQGQLRSLTDEPNTLIHWLNKQAEDLEANLAKILASYAESDNLATWMMTIRGIGPIIAAGFVSKIDFEKAHTAGAIQRLVGYDPSITWRSRKEASDLVASVVGASWPARDPIPDDLLDIISKKCNFKVEYLLRRATDGKRTPTAIAGAISRLPWDKELKVLCWKLGDSFVKSQKRDSDDLYIKLYDYRKRYDNWRNRTGRLADQAREPKYSPNTEAYLWASGQYVEVIPVGQDASENHEDDTNQAISDQMKKESDAKPVNDAKRYLILKPDNTTSELVNPNKGLIKKLISGRYLMHCPALGVPMLPPAHINARAKRYAVSMFLSHMQAVGYYMHHGRASSLPWIIRFGGHSKFIMPPNADKVPGFEEAIKKVHHEQSVDRSTPLEYFHGLDLDKDYFNDDLMTEPTAFSETE